MMPIATKMDPATPPAAFSGLCEQLDCKPTVLVIEDDPYVSAVIWTLLNDNNFTTISESSGPDGLQRVRSILPHIVVLDINLPGMNGLEICRQLKADSKTSALPVVVCSGQTYLASEAMELGAAAFLEKPCDIIKLPACLRQILRHSA